VLDWAQAGSGLAAGLLIAVLTTPVGVSGAVFLLPVQLDLLHVPSPAVTPTNLLFNVVATPTALHRYRTQGQLRGPLVGLLVRATLPGVVIGALVRVHLVPGVRPFRIVAAAVLLVVGGWLCWRTIRPRGAGGRAMTPRSITALGLVVGVVGGVYGIGGGSIIGPVLVGAGMPVAEVAPAALASTFLTSVVGVGSYALIALTTTDPIAPHWVLGFACGLGGAVGSYVGARLQPRVPETVLRLLLGVLAVGVGLGYVVTAGR
jgi:uncharacterized membrane protein YfcA